MDNLRKTKLEECGDDAYFFFQYACELNDTIVLKQLFGLMVGCLCVFIYFFTIVYIDYMKTIEQLSFLDFDVKTSKLNYVDSFLMIF